MNIGGAAAEDRGIEGVQKASADADGTWDDLGNPVLWTLQGRKNGTLVSWIWNDLYIYYDILKKNIYILCMERSMDDLLKVTRIIDEIDAV